MENVDQSGFQAGLSSGRANTEVLVVGAGPVGLALALELGLRGRHVLVIEQNDRGGMQPRAKTTNIRSMTHMRRWGIARRMREASPLPSDYPVDVVFATRLFGKPLARFQNAFFGAPERHPDFPEAAEWIPQYTVEAMMRERLAELPNVTVRFGARLDDFTQDEDGVRASVFDLQAERTVTVDAKYLVGADGGRSTTRRQLGIEFEGNPAYKSNFLAIYEAPGLLEAHPQEKAVSYWIVNPESPAVTGPMDRGDKWFFSTQLADGATPYSVDEARVKIHQTLGREFPIRILETDVWQAHKLIANSYGRGRVFLAGDACHLHPPMGGYGMNQGIGDGVDLGWKLAAILEGWGDPSLLATYEAERKPVHRMFVAEAAANYSFVTYHMVNELLELDTPEGAAARAELGERIIAGKMREFRPIGAILGYTYSPSSIVIDDGSELPAFDPLTYTATARPGSLMPHLWMPDGSSLYDHLGPDYTLVQVGARASEAARQMLDAAGRLGIPLTSVVLDGDEALRRYGAGLVLVRPDQHVAWRSGGSAADAQAVLAQVTGHRQ